MGLGLMLITFVGCLLSVRFPGEVDLLGFTVPARWFTCVSVPIVFAIVAWFNERFIRPIPAAERVAKGQWFLADTFLDIAGATNALLHAMAGTLILITITVIDLGGEVYLPYLLAGESVLGILFGLALRTPQVQIASVLLLASAHVSYYVFLFV